MSKKIKTALVSLACGLMTATLVIASNGPATVDLKGPAGSKPPVAFNHKAHQDKNKCGECHHGKTADGKQDPYKDGQAIAKCSTCHELGKPNDNIHKNCKGCHTEKKAGPQKCDECHVKK